MLNSSNCSFNEFEFDLNTFVKQNGDDLKKENVRRTPLQYKLKLYLIEKHTYIFPSASGRIRHCFEEFNPQLWMSFLP